MGGLAGIIVFCLLGAGTAGLIGSAPLFEQATNNAMRQRAQIEVIAAIVNLTQKTFLISFLSGIGLGSLGSWLACPRRDNQTDVFDKSEQQMALNAAITAVPASVAAALAAAVFSRLADSIGSKTGEASLTRLILDMPLMVSLLLVLVAHFALTLVVPHEAREAEHRCGMDEVRMAAYVGIGTAPILALLLLLAVAKLLLHPLVIVALLASAIMSLKSLQVLFSLILPGRASFPAPQDDWQKIEAKLFSTKKIDLAIAVLGLNIHVYPEHIESYLEQAKLYLKKGEAALAEASLLKALFIKPDSTAAAELLEKVRLYLGAIISL